MTGVVDTVLITVGIDTEKLIQDLEEIKKQSKAFFNDPSLQGFGNTVTAVRTGIGDIVFTVASFTTLMYSGIKAYKAFLKTGDQSTSIFKRTAAGYRSSIEEIRKSNEYFGKSTGALAVHAKFLWNIFQTLFPDLSSMIKDTFNVIGRYVSGSGFKKVFDVLRKMAETFFRFLGGGEWSTSAEKQQEKFIKGMIGRVKQGERQLRAFGSRLGHSPTTAPISLGTDVPNTRALKGKIDSLKAQAQKLKDAQKTILKGELEDIKHRARLVREAQERETLKQNAVVDKRTAATRINAFMKQIEKMGPKYQKKGDVSTETWIASRNDYVEKMRGLVRALRSQDKLSMSEIMNNRLRAIKLAELKFQSNTRERPYGFNTLADVLSGKGVMGGKRDTGKNLAGSGTLYSGLDPKLIKDAFSQAGKAIKAGYSKLKSVMKVGDLGPAGGSSADKARERAMRDIEKAEKRREEMLKKADARHKARVASYLKDADRQKKKIFDQIAAQDKLNKKARELVAAVKREIQYRKAQVKVAADYYERILPKQGSFLRGILNITKAFIRQEREFRKAEDRMENTINLEFGHEAARKNPLVDPRIMNLRPRARTGSERFMDDFYEGIRNKIGLMRKMGGTIARGIWRGVKFTAKKVFKWAAILAPIAGVVLATAYRLQNVDFLSSIHRFFKQQYEDLKQVRNVALIGRTGIREYQTLEIGMEKVGLSAEKARSSMESFGRIIGEVARGDNQEATKAFHTLGLNINQLTKYGSNAYDIILRVSDRIKEIPVAERGAITRALFGSYREIGTAILPFLESKDLRDQLKEIRELYTVSERANQKFIDAGLEMKLTDIKYEAKMRKWMSLSADATADNYKIVAAWKHLGSVVAKEAKLLALHISNIVLVPFQLLIKGFEQVGDWIAGQSGTFFNKPITETEFLARKKEIGEQLEYYKQYKKELEQVLYGTVGKKPEDMFGMSTFDQYIKENAGMASPGRNITELAERGITQAINRTKVKITELEDLQRLLELRLSREKEADLNLGAGSILSPFGVSLQTGIMPFMTSSLQIHDELLESLKKANFESTLQAKLLSTQKDKMESVKTSAELRYKFEKAIADEYTKQRRISTNITEIGELKKSATKKEREELDKILVGKHEELLQSQLLSVDLHNQKDVIMATINALVAAQEKLARIKKLSERAVPTAPVSSDVAYNMRQTIEQQRRSLEFARQQVAFGQQNAQAGEKEFNSFVKQAEFLQRYQSEGRKITYDLTRALEKQRFLEGAIADERRKGTQANQRWIDKVLESKKSVDQEVISLREKVKAYQELSIEAARLAQLSGELAGEQFDADQALRDRFSFLNEARQAASDGFRDFTSSAIKNFDDIGKAAENLGTTIITRMLDRIAARAGDKALDWLFQIGLAAFGAGSGGTSSVPGPHRAGGGRVQAGQAYNINEGYGTGTGGELFIPRVGGTILNRQQMRDVFGGSGGPKEVVNNYYITSNDSSAVYGAIQQAKAEAVVEAEIKIDRNLGRPSTTRNQSRRAGRPT